MKRTDDAIARYREVLDVDAGNLDALAALETLLRQSGRAGDLLGILEKRLELAGSPDDRRAQLYAIAKLAESDLNDGARAVETYAAILAEFGDEDQALRQLDTLYNKLEKWDELAQILERELAVFANDEAAALDAKFRLGRVLEQHLGREADAIEHYREILTINTENAAARGALEALLRNPELRGQAAKILEPIYEMRSDWEALIRSLEILLTDEANVDERISLLRKIGDVCGQQLAGREPRVRSLRARIAGRSGARRSSSGPRGARGADSSVATDGHPAARDRRLGHESGSSARDLDEDRRDRRCAAQQCRKRGRGLQQGTGSRSQ